MIISSLDTPRDTRSCLALSTSSIERSLVMTERSFWPCVSVSLYNTSDILFIPASHLDSCVL